MSRHRWALLLAAVCLVSLANFAWAYPSARRPDQDVF